MLAWRCIVIALLCAAGCNRGKRGPGEAAATEARPSAFAHCVPADAEATQPKGFRHTRSRIVAKFPAVHFMQDVIGEPGAQVALEAKLSYGDIGKDLEDEPVTVRLGDCEGWRVIGAATSDDDGRAGHPVTLPAVPGRFGMAITVDGDATMVRSTAWALPRATTLVVFDVDGTLTTSDDEINRQVADGYFDGLYDGDYVPVAYESAAELTREWAAKGYVVVYLTGRPYWLVDKTRQWLDASGFAAGHVHTTDRHRDVLPTPEGVGRFKAAYLRSLLERGYKIAAAYGNAETDVLAYARAGIPTDITFIIGPNGGNGGTKAVDGGYQDHLKGFAASQPAAQQPFQR